MTNLLRRAALGSAAATLLLGTGACGDFRKPYDLRHAQVLAVRAEHPQIAAGQETRFEVLASGPDGVPFVASPDLLEIAADPRNPAAPPPDALAALITSREDGWWVTAPSEEELAAARLLLGLPEDAPLVLPLRATVAIGEEVRVAQKAVMLGREAANPEVLTLTVDGEVPEYPDVIVLPTGPEEHALGVDADGGAGPLAFSWHAALGELSRYRTAAATFKVEEAGEGALVVVVRDDKGGVGWRIATLRAETP